MLGRLYKKIKTKIPFLSRNDLTNQGERVDIDVSHAMPAFDTLDMYQKSHVRRYEFACQLVKPGMRVIDAACGSGYGSVMLSRQGGQVVGMDISQKVIDRVSRRYAHVNNVRFVQNDVLKIPSSYGPVDLAVSFETLEHLPQGSIPDALKKFAELLKPGGRLIVSTPYLQPETEASRRHHRSFMIDENKMSQWAEAANFNCLETHYQNYETHTISKELEKPDFLITLLERRP